MNIPRKQQGMTLIMALIMLVVLTLLALTSFNLNQTNLQVVSNMQQRDEALAAAREVIEETISSTALFDSPTNILANPCEGNNRRCIDTNGDGATDVTVAITPAPTCVKAQPVKANQLDVKDAEDRECIVSVDQGLHAIEGANTGNSTCTNSIWDVHVVATDVVTEAQVEVTQGIAVRLPQNTIANKCPN